MTTPDDTPRTRRRATLRALPACAVAILAASYALVALLPVKPYALDLASQAAHWTLAPFGVLALLMLACRRRAAAIVTALAALAIGASLVHFASPRPAPNHPHAIPLRVITFNAQNTSSGNDRPLYDWIREQNPDILVVIDALPFFGRHEEWINDNLPYRLDPRRGLAWPIVILSRHPIEAVRLAEPTPELRRSFPAHRAVRVALSDTHAVVVTAVHPYSPRGADKWRTSLLQAQRDGEVIANARARRTEPFIVAADQNSTPLGLSHRRFRAVSGLGARSSPFAGTWPAAKPSLLSFPIDRVWASPGVRFARVSVGPAFRSDHRPVVADLLIPPSPLPPGAPGAPGAAGAPQPDAQPVAPKFPDS